MESKTVFYAIESHKGAKLEDLLQELSEAGEQFTIRELDPYEFISQKYNVWQNNAVMYEVNFYGLTHRPLKNGQIIVVEAKETDDTVINIVIENVSESKIEDLENEIRNLINKALGFDAPKDWDEWRLRWATADETKLAEWKEIFRKARKQT